MSSCQRRCCQRRQFGVEEVLNELIDQRSGCSVPVISTL